MLMIRLGYRTMFSTLGRTYVCLRVKVSMRDEDADEGHAAQPKETVYCG